MTLVHPVTSHVQLAHAFIRHILSEQYWETPLPPMPFLTGRPGVTLASIATLTSCRNTACTMHRCYRDSRYEHSWFPCLSGHACRATFTLLLHGHFALL